jgi:hypothetical protein
MTSHECLDVVVRKYGWRISIGDKRFSSIFVEKPILRKNDCFKYGSAAQAITLVVGDWPRAIGLGYSDAGG